MTIRVSAELLKLAYVAVSSEETRYYLNGVHVEPHPVKGALLVSTDGHRMVCIHDADAVCDEIAIVQLPKFVLAQCTLKKSGLGIDRKVIEVDGKAQTATLITERVGKEGKVLRSDPLVTAHRVIIEGTFPDWRRVTPQGKMAATGIAGFNSKLIAEMASFGTRLGTGGMYFLRKEGEEEGAPVLIRWSRVNHVFAVLMPMRIDAEISLPSFFAEATEAAVPAIAAE